MLWAILGALVGVVFGLRKIYQVEAQITKMEKNILSALKRKK